jgi:hypothetical protein
MKARSRTMELEQAKAIVREAKSFEVIATPEPTEEAAIAQMAGDIVEMAVKAYEQGAKGAALLTILRLGAFLRFGEQLGEGVDRSLVLLTLS